LKFVSPMKIYWASILLLAAPCLGSVLRKQTKKFAEGQAVDKSRALIAESQALDHVLQSVADKLEKGVSHDFLRTLRLCAPCHAFERLGEPHDGGYVMCMDGLDQGIVGAYSYGINGFDGWGMAVASRFHIPLQEYDCTNFNEPAVCAGCQVHFHGECVLENHGAAQYNYKTLTQQLKESGSANVADRSLLLKIDVEAAEWQVFAQEPVANLKKFREIVVEYHWLNKQDQHPLYLSAVRKIEQAGFSVAHLHGNNYGGGLQYFGQYSIPNVLEVTYIQTPAAGCANNIPYHVPQDTPNNAGGAEISDATLPRMF